ncbi:MAG: glycosyl transferase family 36 [Gracilibacter sp. BRH_c7a]|nr:MAG: glycosyl transferase family 36 [Gracilibacter sp. BRH_c7a]
MKEYATELAQFHNWLGITDKGNSLLPLLNDRGHYIKESYQNINQHYYKTEDVIPAAEWYLDNYYLINDLLDDVVKDLTSEYESKLQYFKGGDLVGYPRIYVLISDFVKNNDNELNFNHLRDFIIEYQSEAPLSSAEIWAISIMLKVILLEKIFYQVERIIYIQKEREFAENWLNSILGGESNSEKITSDDLDLKSSYSTIFIERVAKRFKELGPDAKVLINWLDNIASKQNLTVEKVISNEHYHLTSQGVIMGNIISTLKLINSENWSEFFEEVSLVQHVLYNDPAQIFAKMDFDSRDKYRHEIENLASKFKVSELTVVSDVEELAKEQQNTPENHVGYYLLGPGKVQLEKKLADNWGKVNQFLNSRLFKNPLKQYLSLISLSTLIPFLIFLWLVRGGLDRAPLGIGIITIISSLAIFAGMAIFLGNRLCCKASQPSFLPKLFFEDVIPEDLKTVVVIPAIFSDAEKVKEQLTQLEIHYLNNREDNIYFAILGDFIDAKKETISGDDEIIEAGIKGVKKLNQKYGNSKFFYFHRTRQWNEQEKIWMGWERKRGKLIEFNQFLLKERETSYLYQSGKTELLKDIRYVITLDADTLLPRDIAKKLIGTIAHPMQKAKMDEDSKRVISGYGIIQPRISLTAESAFATPYAKISTGIAGIDPYTCAISDVYQDLFGEGIYTGKGIYDLNIFHAVTRDTFSENTILSHDLIEGLHARTGLATDIELFDGYPSKYLAHTKRTHRWIRGDWQIAKYIFDAKLSFISRWKIADNLRRSLDAPIQLIMLFLGFTYLNNYFALMTGLVILSLSLPLLLNIFEKTLDRSLTRRIIKHELTSGLKQILFSLVTLPYQAYIQSDAIVRSVFRQLVSKRLLLEWEAASECEKRLELNLSNFYFIMFRGLVLSILFGVGYFFVNVTTGVLLTLTIITWLSSPIIAYKLSLPYRRDIPEISPSDNIELRKWARQIWAFFDTFVEEENNYLPPDNIQIEPYKGIAHRSSPTNIGLALLANLVALDLGYVSQKMMIIKIRNTLSTISKLPKWKGHIYNWYNTKNLEPLNPIYISTVDSGNFAGYLIVLKNGVAQLAGTPPVQRHSIIQGLQDTFNIFNNNISGTPLEHFGEELYNLQRETQSLKSLYIFLEKYQIILHSMVQDLHQLKDKTTEGNSFDFWSTTLFNMLSDYKKAIEKFYPYIVMAEMPEELQGIESLSTRNLARKYSTLLQGNQNISDELKTHVREGLKNTLLSLLWVTRIQQVLKRIVVNMEFKPLYHKQKKLFSIGYNLSEQRLDNSYYDLLASEARQASLIAIAKGDVPEEHWFKLSRPLTRIEGNRCLVSWSGTMFEFLTPLIIFKNYPGTLMYESNKSVVEIQRQYTKNTQIPWGISESGFFSFDIQNNYQYKAFGVPGLGLKRGLSKDMVISPYSTFMALLVDYPKSIKNLKLMTNKGFNGLYGLYEAIDFTPTRVPYNKEYSLVKSYMAHHQGMSLVSLGNLLTNNIMRERFHKEPMIRSIEILLQEQVPLKEYTFNPIMEEEGEKKATPISRKKGEKPAIYHNPNTIIPRTSFISNREYSIMLTLNGSGYSKFNDIYISRWREDPTIDLYGTFIYIQNLNSGSFWSATSKPLDYPGENYKVTCFPNTVKYYRKDGNIETLTEVFVSPEDPVEIRKLTLSNHSEYSRDIQLTSYLEVALDQLNADIAHPTFSKLFIQTRFENNTLVAFRRPRHEGKKKIFLMHTLLVEGETLGNVEYETDRTKFIGRGRSLADPRVMDINQPLSNSVGAVLDPIMSLRTRVRINPGKTVTLYFITGVGEKKEGVLSLAEKYRSTSNIHKAKELSWSQSLMELTNLDLSFDKANQISSLASQVIYPGRIRRNINIIKNNLGQSALWQFSVPGDLPIVLLSIQDSNNLKMVDQMLRIHEFWKIKGLFVDLVIINEDKTGYFQSIQDAIQEKIGISHVRMMVNKPGGVFILKKDQLSPEILILLRTVARMRLSADKGSLNNQIAKYVQLGEQNILDQGDKKEYVYSKEVVNEDRDTSPDNSLMYYNGYGGFSEDGKEYVIYLTEGTMTPLPWVNVIANKKFGFLITGRGSSYTWSQNSREYKLSPWSNDPLLDYSGEALYLKDEITGRYWSPTPQPARDNKPYTIRHGQGYTVFEHISNDIKQETKMFVPLYDSLKIVELKLTNLSPASKKLAVYYYMEWTLGTSREQNSPYLVTEPDEDAVFCRNVYQEEFAQRVSFIKGNGGRLKSFTCDRQEFIGINRTLQHPRSLENEVLSGRYGSGLDPCTVLQLEANLEPGEEKSIYFIIGDDVDSKAARDLAQTYSNQETIKQAYTEIINYWNEILTTIQISTPEKSLDLLVNRWLIYQTVVCRIWARSAFYQSGGAYGFRDQLQDVMSLAILRPEMTRDQIILHSSRQFPEGDVQHWWHPEKGKGIRTKFSDDLLWLPFVTADYIEHTGDYSVLEEKTPFLDQELLGEEEDERYAIPKVTEDYATVYEHCVRAIDRGLKFGSNGLPLIGTGDWNDGFSAIGREGKGESIWLGWFILLTLKRFMPICQKFEDNERYQRYGQVMTELLENMEKNAWDGSWYRRAYFDDGTPVGSISSSECQIDSIAQSWAIISESGRDNRVKDAMLAVERYLWDKEEGILKLFTPPFDKTEHNPGYIRGYIPGVRENGGQYTHAAIWTILAYTKLGDKDKAMELFNMLNPINHSRTKAEVAKYKVEPYVIAADVYDVYPNVGRGGWTWYTGAAGWMYQAAIEGILGISINNDKMTVSPCVPTSWPGYTINYRYKNTDYVIEVQLGRKEKIRIVMDETESDGFPVSLIDDGQTHILKIEM